jgi:hypothetical protein
MEEFMKKTLLAAALMVFAMIMVSCNSDDLVTPDETGTMAFMSPSYAINNGMTDVAVYGCTENDDFSMDIPMMEGNGRGNDKGRGNGDEMRKLPINFRGMPIYLGRILYQMQLTEEQQVELKGYLDAFHECATLAREGFRELAEPILEEARADRRQVMADLKAGLLTREEARAALNEINNIVRQQIEALKYNEAFCLCLENLLNNIAGLQGLTQEQIDMFNEWRAALTGPCFETED